jgi:anti-sigma regulatory factor (Ser/Thr protein kinase)
MGQVRIALQVYAREGLAPADALGRLNRLVFDSEPATIATLWYGEYDPETGRLVFTSAGHPAPLLIGPDHATQYVEELRAAPLGALPQTTYPQSSCSVDASTAILLFTDGLVERRGESIDARLERLRSAAEQGPSDLEQLCDHVVAELVDGVPRDDVALLAVRATSAGRRIRLTRPASPAAVSDARRVVRAWLTSNGVTRVDSFDVLVATSEAFANAVQHAYGLEEGTVEIEGALDRDALEISVRDQGCWQPRAVANGGGRGLAMMRALMDSVEVDADAGGTEVRMTRRLQTAVVHG